MSYQHQVISDELSFPTVTYTVMDASQVLVHTRFLGNSSELMFLRLSWAHLMSSVGLGVVVILTDPASGLPGTECTRPGRNPPCFIVREAVSGWHYFV